MNALVESDFEIGRERIRTTDGIDYSFKSNDNLDIHVFDSEGFFSV